MLRHTWWGWGNPETQYSMAEEDGLASYLELEMGRLEKPTPAVPVEAMEVSSSNLTSDDVVQLQSIVGKAWVHTDKSTRIGYSFGKSYKDLIRVRSGVVDLITDAVVLPKGEGEVERILAWASDNDISIIPFGGGTSVVGGVERHPFSSRTVTISLERFSNLVEIDEISLTARCQAGIMGPDLEEKLNEAGLSLGHFPESFEFSTLGGWIATRGAGQASTKYGKIEDMVQSVRMVTPGGIVESGAYPAQATGGDLLQSFIGSEGTLGIITEAVIKIHKIPEVCNTMAYFFDDFCQGVKAIRNMLQRNVVPAIVRLSNRQETAISLKLREFERGGRDLKQRVVELYLRLRRRSVSDQCLLILGFEGTDREVRYERGMAGRIIRRHGGLSLGRSPGRAWRKSRFNRPYLRDRMISLGILVDTVETSTTWSNILPLYESVKAALEDSFASVERHGLVLTHVSHAYSDGASLYFTFLLPAQRGREIDEWEKIKSDAVEAIVTHGGSLSHHHGIGKDHVRWMESFLGRRSLEVLRGTKRQLDPSGIMNPGTLVPSRWERKRDGTPGDRFSMRIRQNRLRQLDTESFDLLVIGGGITGAGIAWDAALRGMKVALIEKGDFGSGTSSKSSKMIHGGLRYLKQLNVKLVKESLHERGLLLKLAPHLVRPTPHIIPIYGHAALKMMELRIGLTGYDILAGSLNIAKHEKLSAEEVIQRIPTLAKEGLKGGFLYYDCLVNDARLTLTVILSGARAGAVAVNYVKARRILSEEGRVSGAEYKDMLTGKRGMIRASVVISAVGPWTDEVRHLAGERGNLLRQTKGIHLVFDRNRLPSDDVVLLFGADGRPVFLVPWDDCSYVGTTDTDFDGDLDDIRATREDVNYILDTIQTYFTQQEITFDDILGSWAGVRPLVAMKGSPSGVSRDYTIEHGPSGLVTVSGGKLTTFRSMAKEVVDELLQEYSSNFDGDFGECTTESTKLVGAETGKVELFREAVRENLSDWPPLNSSVVDRLISTYGTRFLSLLGYGVQDPSLLKPIYPGSRVIFGDIFYAIEKEMAVTLNDFMERRSGLKHFSQDHGLSAVNRIARIVGQRLGWSFSETQDEIKRYVESVRAGTAFDTEATASKQEEQV